jgi:hypothetical protein
MQGSQLNEITLDAECLEEFVHIGEIVSNLPECSDFAKGQVPPFCGDSGHPLERSRHFLERQLLSNNPQSSATPDLVVVE